MSAVEGVSREAAVVIVPAFNEDAVIGGTLDELVSAGYRVVVVDDGSHDRTWEVASGFPVHALRHPINLGQGAALQTGTSYALRHHFEHFVHFDADGQHRVEDIAVLLEPLQTGEADVVMGSRFLKKEDRRAVPLTRRMLLRGAIVVNLVLFRMWLSDAHNGLRALNRRAASAIQLCEDGYAHASEILLQIRRGRLRWVERPTHVTYSDYSRAKGQKGWHAVDTLIDLLVRRLFW